MRILHLCPEIPELHGTGGGRREWELVCGLRARGHEITVISVARRDQQPAIDALRGLGIETIAAVRPEPQWREALATSLRAPRLLRVLAREGVFHFQGAVFAEEIRGPIERWLAEGGRADVALVQHDWVMREFSQLLPDDLPIIVGFHYQALMHQRAAQTTTGVRRRFEQREARLQRDDMTLLPSNVVAGSACSQTEADAFSRLSGLPCSVVPNGADTAALAHVPLAGGTTGRLLFSGTLGYPPNADAAVWLAREVLPLVQQDVPAAVLTIVGRGAPPSVEALAAPDVILTGFVPEMEPYLAEAEVYVAGLLSGAGTKLKVVEALAAGRPLVATPVAAEGIDIEHEVHALIAEGAAPVAAAIVRLLRDRELAARLAQAGRTMVQAQLSWDAAVDVLDAQVQGVAG